MTDPPFAVPASFQRAFTARRTLRRGIALWLQRPMTYLGLTLSQGIPVLVCLGLLYVVLGPDGWDQVGETADNPGWFWENEGGSPEQVAGVVT